VLFKVLLTLFLDRIKGVATKS